MAGLEIKNAQQPDERRSMSGKGEVQIVKVGDHSAMAGSWGARLAVVGAHEARRRHRQL
jgi:hypothetical protein